MVGDPRPARFAPLLRVLFTVTGIVNLGGYVSALIGHSPDAVSYLAMSTACLGVVLAAAALWPRRRSSVDDDREGPPVQGDTR